MADKKRYAIVVGIVIIAILILANMKGCNPSSGGGGGGGGSGGTTHAPCEDCQAIWMTGTTAIWECSGLCSVGACYMSSGDPKNPNYKPICTCGTRTDNCQVSEGYVSSPTCGGTCVNSDETCQFTTDLQCKCRPRTTDTCHLETGTSLRCTGTCATGTCSMMTYGCGCYLPR